MFSEFIAGLMQQAREREELERARKIREALGMGMEMQDIQGLPLDQQDVLARGFTARGSSDQSPEAMNSIRKSELAAALASIDSVGRR